MIEFGRRVKGYADGGAVAVGILDQRQVWYDAP